MTEVYFYHLERSSLETVLPRLLQASLNRGWRVVVQAGSDQRVEALAGALWTFDEEVFLPHGTKADGFAELQPVWITDTAETPMEHACDSMLTARKWTRLKDPCGPWCFSMVPILRPSNALARLGSDSRLKVTPSAIGNRTNRGAGRTAQPVSRGPTQFPVGLKVGERQAGNWSGLQMD